MFQATLATAAFAPARRIRSSWSHSGLLAGVFLAALLLSPASEPPVTAQTADAPTADAPTANAPTADAPTAAAPADPAVAAWAMYKNDPQRTGGGASALSAPLNLMWRHSTELPPQPNYASPLVAGAPGQRRIYFDAGGFVYCLDAQTGSQVWRSTRMPGSLSAPLTFLPNKGGDLVLAASYGGQINALRASDGSVVWQADAGGSVAETAPTLLQTARGERIIVGNGLGQIVAFTRDGQRDPEWNITLGRSAAPTSSPVVSPDGQRLFITAQDSKIYAVDVALRNVYFALPLGGRTRSTPLILRGILVATAGTRVLAYRESTGAPLWRQEVPHSVVSSPAGLVDAEGNGTIFIGTVRGLFTAFDLQSGEKKWETDLQSSVTGTPLALPNMVLVGTSNGMLYGLDPATGAFKWQYRMDATQITRPDSRRRGRRDRWRGRGRDNDQIEEGTQSYGISSEPAIVGEQVFVLADNAALYAFDTRPFDAVPPQPVEPSISVFNTSQRLQPMLMGQRRQVFIPGTGPIYFAVQLDESGSGVDPDTLRVTLNGQPVAPEEIIFQPSTNIVSVTLLPRDVKNLPDGTYTVGLIVSDYRGNELNYTGNFEVDNSLPTPGSSWSARGGRGNFGGRRNNAPDGMDGGPGEMDDNPEDMREGADEGEDDGDDGGEMNAAPEELPIPIP